MEMVEQVLNFFNSYPTWAKVSVFAGIVVVASILMFAPRNSSQPESNNNTNRKSEPTRFLEIEGIKLFPSSPTTQVQLYILVNGTRYRHPAVAGVEWMYVGPDMNKKIIELPEAERYEVRFELVIRDGETITGDKTTIGEPDMTSNVIRYILKLPYSEEYKLYPVENKVRGANVGSTVSYKVYES